MGFPTANEPYKTTAAADGDAWCMELCPRLETFARKFAAEIRVTQLSERGGAKKNESCVATNKLTSW